MGALHVLQKPECASACVTKAEIDFNSHCVEESLEFLEQTLQMHKDYMIAELPPQVMSEVSDASKERVPLLLKRVNALATKIYRSSSKEPVAKASRAESRQSLDFKVKSKVSGKRSGVNKAIAGIISDLANRVIEKTSVKETVKFATLVTAYENSAVPMCAMVIATLNFAEAFDDTFATCPKPCKKYEQCSSKDLRHYAAEVSKMDLLLDVIANFVPMEIQ